VTCSVVIGRDANILSKLEELRVQLSRLDQELVDNNAKFADERNELNNKLYELDDNYQSLWVRLVQEMLSRCLACVRLPPHNICCCSPSRFVLRDADVMFSCQNAFGVSPYPRRTRLTEY